MARELRTFQPLEGPAGALAAAFASDPAMWLPDPDPVPDPGPDPDAGAGSDRATRSDSTTSGTTSDTWVFAVHAGSLARRVRATIGQPWHATRTSWRSVSWEPVAMSDEQTSVNRLLPPLDGEVGIHIDESGRATLVFDARYLPPGGFLGAAVDAVVLHRLARQTGQRFLEDVAVGLSRIALSRIAPERSSPEHAGTSPSD